MASLMRSRLFWRRSAAAAGTYSSAVLGFLGTIVAYHVFSTRTFGLYAIVLAAAGFFQSLLDLTMEEALIKFGFRYVTREDWGRLRRLFTSAIVVKLAGGILAAIVLVALAPASHAILHKNDLATPLGAERRDVISFVGQSSIASAVTSLTTPLAILVLGRLASTTQVAWFRAALSPQQAFAALSSPARLILLTEQTRDWERGTRAPV